jgi:hypothetical protein
MITGVGYQGKAETACEIAAAFGDAVRRFAAPVLAGSSRTRSAQRLATAA